MLKKNLQQILTCENLDTHRAIAKALADELGIEMLDLAAVLIYLDHRDNHLTVPVESQNPVHQIASNNSFTNFKLIRYRLSVGSQHQVTEDDLKKVLVNESGVDINNITNVVIQGLFTLVNLPDNMPQDIFLHLKTVEINQQMLDIKRVKSGNPKKRGKNRNRRARQRNSKLVQGVSDQVNGG
jgi:hypothetical protein